jgi:hypothetical protein
VRFLWFWTFWHWSRESFRGGALLRGPVLGIGGHWDEWFRHEASADDRQAIADVGADPLAQRQFIVWLARRWAREAEWRGHRPPVRFVLRQLAPFPPFDRWPAMAKWRAGYGVPGVSAIVLAEGSAGEPSDVYAVEALAVHADAEPSGRRIVPEGFRADPADLETARQAAFSLSGGRGLAVLLALWVAGGRRPYPRWLGAALGIGWLAVGALIVRLLVGADPGGALVAMSATLVTLWLALALTAAAVAGAVAVEAWRGGRTLRERLEQSEVRLRMDGGLTIHGASAGLAFCLDTMLALFRAEPAVASRSWLWRRLLLPLRTRARSWAATGVVTADARVRPVVLAPKLRATLRHRGITQLVTPDRGGRARARWRARPRPSRPQRRPRPSREPRRRARSLRRASASRRSPASCTAIPAATRRRR